MVFEGDWMESAIKSDEQDDTKFDFFLPPTEHDPLRYSAFPEQIMIAKTSSHPDAAAEFINWWISPETQSKFLLELGGLTATKGVAARPERVAALVQVAPDPRVDKATYPPTDRSSRRSSTTPSSRSRTASSPVSSRRKRGPRSCKTRRGVESPTS